MDPEYGSTTALRRGAEYHEIEQSSVPLEPLNSSQDYGQGRKMLGRNETGRTIPPIEAPRAFIPHCADLRAICIEHIGQKLFQVRDQLDQLDSSINNANWNQDQASEHKLSQQREALRDQCVDLMGQLDAQIVGEIRMWELLDPDYGKQRGISSLQVKLDDTRNQKTRGEDWLAIINRGIEPGSRDTHQMVENVDPSPAILEFARRRGYEHTDAASMVFRRRDRTLWEQQSGVVYEKEDHTHGSRKEKIRYWKFIFALAALVMIAFFAVGIVASSTKFTETFIKFYFVIALIWSLTSSSFMCAFLIKFVGVEVREATALFLAMIGVWLVVIQVGQTRIAQQVQG